VTVIGTEIGTVTGTETGEETEVAAGTITVMIAEEVLVAEIRRGDNRVVALGSHTGI
jgi:hypothetical protein